MDTTVKITLRVPDQVSLNKVLALVPGIHLDCGAPRQVDGNGLIIDVFGTPAQAKLLEATSFVDSIDRKYGEVLAARQAEVSQVDRFKGGKIKPNGIGVKRP